MVSLKKSLSIVILVTLVAVFWFVSTVIGHTYSFTEGPGGRGVFAEVPVDGVLEQAVSFEVSEESGYFFVAADERKDLSKVRGSIESGDVEIDLGYGDWVVIEREDKPTITGLAWQLPMEASAISGVRLTNDSRSTIQLVADERSASDNDAARLVVAEDSVKLPASLSVGLLERQSIWSTLTAEEQDSFWWQLGQLIVGGIATILLVVFGYRWFSFSEEIRRKVLIIGSVCLVLGGLFYRLWLAYHLPLVNDEQFYIHDAVLFDMWDPVFWKTPVLITGLRLWMMVFGLSSLLVMRSFIVVASVVALLLLAWIAYRLAGRLAGFATLAVGMVAPVVAPFTALIMTEQMMMLPAVGAAALAVYWRDQEKMRWWQVLVISGVLGLATAARWSALFWFVPVVLLLRSSWREWLRRIAWLAAPYVAALIGFFALFPDIIAGWRIGDIFVEFFERSGQRGWLAKFRAWREPMARLTPLLVLSVLALTGRRPWQRVQYVVVVCLLLALLVPVLQSGMHAPLLYGHSQLIVWLLVLLVLSGAALHSGISRKILIDALLFIIPGVLAYVVFHKVNAKYLAELIPGLVLVAGLGASVLLRSVQRRTIGAVLLMLLLSWWLLPWYGQAFQDPYAGTLAAGTVRDVVTQLRAVGEPGDRVVSGSSIFALLAGLEPAYPISHPAWILPKFRGEPDDRFPVLYDPIDDDLQAGNVHFAIDEKLTTDTYRLHEGVDEALSELFSVIRTFDNDGSAPVVLMEYK